MKNILILYPHWPPSNLAGVHRSRLISNFLEEFGWHPILLTVHEKFYEEELDADIEKTVSATTEVIKVDAKPVSKSSRVIGDIALRAFGNIKKKAIEIIKSRSIDFMWVPIPSFYTAIIARKVYNETQIKYGIDYIDPWVDSFVGQDKFMSKAWISNQVAKLMEPYSVKKACLISGVATSYYQGVLDRNFKNKKIHHVGMPYGFDPNDHKINLENIDLPWSNETNAYIYAGAFLPKSHYFLKQLFAEIKELKQNNNWRKNDKLYFIGTGIYPGTTIQEYAAQYELGDIVFEKPERKPFLYVLTYLNKAKGIIVLGSVEKHYTASKIFQSLLSNRPVFTVFHEESSAVKILKDTKANNYLVTYNEEKHTFNESLKETFKNFLNNTNWNPNLEALDNYSAKTSARLLVEKIEQAIQ